MIGAALEPVSSQTGGLFLSALAVWSAAPFGNLRLGLGTSGIDATFGILSSYSVGQRKEVDMNTSIAIVIAAGLVAGSILLASWTAPVAQAPRFLLDGGEEIVWVFDSDTSAISLCTLTDKGTVCGRPASVPFE